MRAIINGRILTKEGPVEGKSLVFDEKIIAITSEPGDMDSIDARGGIVAPGLIDVHIHGYLGADASDGDLPGLRRMAKGLAENGVTSFLPTTMTVDYPTLETAFAVIRELMRTPQPGEARALGVNAEGPYLSKEKRGAHDPNRLHLPDSDFLKKHSDIIRLTTIAPELDGALDCIKAARLCNIRAAIGHTTANFALAQRAVDAGATHATHTFNAMPTLGHREPGAAGSALWDDRVYCELIADRFHVHPAWFKLLRILKGDRLVLVTDCTRAGGLGDGDYDLGGQIMRVDGIKCLLPDGTIAGSVLRLNAAVKNMIELGEASPWEALRMASEFPAHAIGVSDRKGALEPGKDADIAVFDAKLNALHTIVAGQTAFVRR